MLANQKAILWNAPAPNAAAHDQEKERKRTLPQKSSMLHLWKLVARVHSHLHTSQRQPTNAQHRHTYMHVHALHTYRDWILRNIYMPVYIHVNLCIPCVHMYACFIPHLDAYIHIYIFIHLCQRERDQFAFLNILSHVSTYITTFPNPMLLLQSMLERKSVHMRHIYIHAHTHSLSLSLRLSVSRSLSLSLSLSLSVGQSMYICVCVDVYESLRR